MRDSLVHPERNPAAPGKGDSVSLREGNPAVFPERDPVIPVEKNPSALWRRYLPALPAHRLREGKDPPAIHQRVTTRFRVAARRKRKDDGKNSC